jgi:hypothetical protein
VPKKLNGEGRNGKREKIKKARREMRKEEEL